MMAEKITIRRTIIQGAKDASLLIEVPAVSVPASLRSGEEIIEAIQRLFETTRKARLEGKRECFLKRAQEAEAKDNDFKAGRAFALALYCDGILRSVDAYGYVRSAMPVY